MPRCPVAARRPCVLAPTLAWLRCPHASQWHPVGSYLSPFLAPVSLSSLLQHLYDFFKAYSGRLNTTAKTVIVNVEAGRVFPHTGHDQDVQAHAIVKVRTQAPAHVLSPAEAESWDVTRAPAQQL